MSAVVLCFFYFVQIGQISLCCCRIIYVSTLNTSTVMIHFGTTMSVFITLSKQTQKKANESGCPALLGLLCAVFQLTPHMFTLNHVISLTQWAQTSTTVLVWLLLSYNNTTFRFSNFAVKSGLSELSWCSYLSPDSVTIASLQLWVYHWGRLASIYKTHLHFSAGPPD